MDPEVAVILDDIVKALTALGVIITAISSFTNRQKLNTMDEKIVQAAVKAAVAAETARIAADNSMIAAANTVKIVAKADEVKAQTAELGTKLAEVREAALAVNAEVIDKIKNGGKER